MSKEVGGTIRIMIADDHAILREGLISLLSSEQHLEVVAQATDGREAIRIAGEAKPDVLLMDLSMPNTNGSEAIKAIKRRHDSIKIIALTVHRTEEYVRATLDAGADGYVLKDDSRQELLSAVRCVLEDKHYLSAAVTGKVLTGYLNGGSKKVSSAPSWTELTTREREVLKLVAEHYKTREIAEILSISPKTVEKHRGSLMKRLDLHCASALTAYAIENGLASAL